MPVKLVASDVANERVMMTAGGMMNSCVCDHCRLMAERRDVLSGERMADRLAAVVQEQRTISHLRERDEHYNIAPINVLIGRLTNATTLVLFDSFSSIVFVENNFYN